MVTVAVKGERLLGKTNHDTIDNCQVHDPDVYENGDHG